MTHTEFRQALDDLELSVAAAALMLGCHPQHVRKLMQPPGSRYHRNVTDTMARLIEAYLAGYRPTDWSGK